MKLKRNIFLGLKEFLLGKKRFPSNFIITAAHGSFKIPLSVFPKLSAYYQTSPRLLLNFSDYGTKYLLEHVPSEQKIVPRYGRLIGDPNRKKNAKDIIRFRDFGGHRIFSDKFEKRLTESWFHTFWLRKILKLSYYPFYEKVFKSIEQACKNPKNEKKPIILIDIHDTGNLILGPVKSKDLIREDHLRMPKVILSNAPDEPTGENCLGTAPDYLMEILQEALAQKLGLNKKEVKINYLFKGGNITRFFGNPYGNERLKKILKNKKIYTIQLEFDRALYMDESTQRPIRWKVKSVRNTLMETFREMESQIISMSE